MDKIEELLNRGVANIIPDKSKLEKLLRSGKKLNIYLGIDPTATKIHLGNSVPLRKIQAFADLGHNVIFLIGDFTALIGDTSDKESERPVLSYKQIQENFKTYKIQAKKILDFTKVRVRYNSLWLKKLTFEDVVKLTQHFSLGDFIAREIIKKRMLAKSRVGLHEVLYPIMQGYDSYYMDTDIQIGGTDQTFNMQAGRILQKDFRNKESYIISNIFLNGTDGRKMSKTWNNAIWLTDEPNDMYGKIMSITDDQITSFLELATNMSIDRVKQMEKLLFLGKMKHLEAKKELAHKVVSELHGSKNANLAKEEFERVFQKRGIPSKLVTIILDKSELPVLDLFTHSMILKSKSEVKRLIAGRAIEIDGRLIESHKEIIKLPEKGVIIKVGKRQIVKALPFGSHYQNDL